MATGSFRQGKRNGAMADAIARGSVTPPAISTMSYVTRQQRSREPSPGKSRDEQKRCIEQNKANHLTPL